MSDRGPDNKKRKDRLQSNERSNCRTISGAAGETKRIERVYQEADQEESPEHPEKQGTARNAEIKTRLTRTSSMKDHRRRWHEVASNMRIKKSELTEGCRNSVRRVVPTIINQLEQLNNSKKFEDMSCDLDDSKEEENQKPIKHSNMRRWQDGSPNEESS